MSAQLQPINYVDDHLWFERLIADLSKRFITVDSSQVDGEIEAAQKLVCERLDVDRCTLAQWNEDSKSLVVTHCWGVPGCASGHKFPIQDVPWIVSKVLRGELVHFARISDLPSEAAKDKETLRRLGVESNASVPISAGGRVFADLAFSTFRAEHEWPELLLARLRLIADLFAHALARKNSAHALSESQERTRLAVESAKLGLWTWSLQNDEIWASERAYSLFGQSPSAHLTYENFLDAVHPDDRASVRDSITSTVLLPMEFQLRYRLVRPDGTVRWISNRGRSYADTTGKSTYISGVVVDITDRQEGDERFRIAVESSPTAMVMVDAEGKIVLTNAQVEKIFGYQREELIGRSVDMLVPLRFREGHSAFRAESASRPSARPMGAGRDLYGVRKDGSEFPIEIGSNPIQTDEGTMVLSAITDITDRIRATEAAHNREELFRTVANSVPVLIWMSGTDKQCTFLNDGWLKFTGRTMEEETGNGWAAGVHPDDLDRCLEVYTTAFDARKEFEMEYRLRRFDGEFRWIVDRGAPTFEPDGTFSGYVGSCMDVTERKRAEETVRESEERLRLAVHAGKMYAFEWDAATDEIIRSEEVLHIPGLIGEPIRLTKQQLLARVHPEDRSAFNSLIAECTPESPNHQVSFRLLRPDGSVVWLERTGHAFFDEQRRMVRMIGMVADITERRRTEEELCEKEMEFLEAQRLAQVGSWQWDPQTDTVTWSPELYRLTGRDPSLPAASYKEHSQLLTAESWERLQRSVEKALRSGTPYELDLEYVRPDGSTIWARARGEALRGITSQIVGLRGTAQDITERRLAERELALANERVRLAMESGKSMGWEWDIKTGRSSWFGDLQCIFGMPSETYVGRIEDFYRLVHPEDRVPVMEAAKDAMENKKEYAKEFRILWPDGTLRWVEAKGKFLYSPDGEPERMLGIKVDITERKLMEVALRESEERFRTVANSAPVLIWMSGPDKLCTFFNDGWLKFTGRTMEEEAENGWAAGVHPDDLDRCLEVYTTAFDARKEFEMEYRLRRFDGEFRWIVDRGAPTFEPDGTFSGYVGSCIDITERKQSQQLLLEANEHLLEANHRNEKLKELLERENVYLQKEITVERNHHEIVGRSEAIRQVMMKAEQVAPTNSTVLLLGETGTGKELVARAIHRNSKRKNRLMVKVNCAALPATLVENELFGREKGAYTGALTREIGRFELAHESTIFLDEIGELPLELQAKLLRVLQEGEFERLGSSRTIHVDVRLIAATSRDLEAAVRDGKFREDLYYRLNVFPIHIPPLRERREDIPMLTWHFLRDLGGRMGREVESVRATTMSAFQNYSWPGNVRELRNVIERHLITNPGPLFQAELPEAIHTAAFAEVTAEESERGYIRRALERTGWRIRGRGGAAEVLGLKPTTLESRMKKLGVVRQ